MGDAQVRLDGKLVTRVARVAWQPDDEREVRDTTIIGRGVVDTEGGGRSHALIISHRHTSGHREADGGIHRKLAVVWERSTSRFVCFALTEDA